MKTKTYTSGQVAKLLDIPARTVRRYIRTGRIPALQNPLTGRWRVPHESLMAFAQRFQFPLKPTGPRGRVLLISHRSEVEQSLAVAVERMGSDLIVSRLANVYQALLTLWRLRPNAILLDLAMPKLDAAGLVQALRNDESARTIGLVLIGANDSAAPEWNAVGERIPTVGHGAPEFLIPRLQSLLRRVASGGRNA